MRQRIQSWPIRKQCGISGQRLSLCRDDLIALVLAQQARIQMQADQIAALTARSGELEAKLSGPPKTPSNSRVPPSKGQKPNLPNRGKKKPRPSRPGAQAR